jgi:hypothetical protein
VNGLSLQARSGLAALLLLGLACGETSSTGVGGAGNSSGAAAGGSSAGGTTSGSSGTAGSVATGGSASGTGGASGSDTGGGGGAGGSAMGGSAGQPGCVIGAACEEPEATCSEDSCCPCLLACRDAVWEAVACPGCAAPCPPEPPTQGERCDPCAGGSVCRFDNCPAELTEAVCDDGEWTVSELACGGPGCGCISDRDCPSGALCISTICKEPVVGGCWRDDQCEPDMFCAGDVTCACNERCAFPDRNGACAPDDGGCCDRNDDCGALAQCVSGVCKAPPAEATGCWSNSDCDSGPCEGAQVCACGTACLVPDSEGSCP